MKHTAPCSAYNDTQCRDTIQSLTAQQFVCADRERSDKVIVGYGNVTVGLK